MLRQALPIVVLSAVVGIVLGGIALRPPHPQVPAAVVTGERPYDRAERLARARWADFALTSPPGTPSAADAADSLVRALLDNGRGWAAETLALARSAVAIREATGASTIELAHSLVGLGAVLTASADYDEALAVLHRAEQLVSRDVRRAGSDGIVDVLDHLGATLTLAGRYEEALSSLARSLAIKTRTRAQAGSIAQTLEGEALAAQGAGLYSRSGAAIRRAMALRDRSNGPDDPARVTTLNLLAQQLWFEGRVAESQLASEDAARLAARTLRATHPRVAETIRWLAATYADLGDLERSRPERERALRIANAEFGPDHVETAAYLNSAAIGDLSAHDYVSARERFTEVLTIVESHFGAWHDYVATTRLNLALVHAQLGDYTLAAQEHDQAIAIWERLLGPDHPYVAVALSELANVYARQNRASAARDLLQRALTIRERRLGSSHPQTARTLIDLAATLMQLDEYTAAQRAADRALVIWRQRNVPNAPDYAQVLALDARIQHQLGRYAAAEPLYLQALQILDRAFGKASPEYADTEALLSRTLASLGKRSAALRTALEAETTGREHLRLLLRALPENQAVEYAAARPRALDVLISLALTAAEAAEPALDALVRTRALVLDTIAGRQHVRTATKTQARVAWRAAQQRLANLLVRGPGPATVAQYNQIVDRARRDRDAAEAEMAATDAAFREERGRAQLGLDDVTGALPTGAAIVSFVRFREERLAGATPGVELQTAYAAFVIRKGRPPMSLRIGDADVVDTQVERWRESLASSLGAAAWDAPSDRAGDTLRRTVWDPLAPFLRDTRMVFVVPDGALALVPFMALPALSGGYLLEQGPVIHYLTAERDLLTRGDVPLGKGGLLAVGGAAFGRRQSDVRRVSGAAAPMVAAGTSAAAAILCGLGTQTFPALPGTLREVRDISELWSRADLPPGLGARVLSGSEATETRFKQYAPAYRVLHLATHGFFVASRCPGGPRQASRGIGAVSTAAGAAIDNPLELSGLAMAGANDPTATDAEDDGVLTAEEVAALDLSGVEWAVLSACDTGLGTLRVDEGVFGLRRAFQMAGVRTVIMSLWSVDDASTREWMRALYSARLLRHASTSEAVHDASLSVLRARRAAGLSTHPVFWASFVAVGDWH